MTGLEAADAAKKAEFAALMEQYAELRRFNKLAFYGPGLGFEPTAKQLEAHAAGGDSMIDHRCLMAANQSGKTVCAAAELAMHLTGRYPAWWTGLRFINPIQAWAAGVTGTTTRDSVQAKLLGENQEWGAGFIPQDALDGDPMMARGTTGAVDYFKVRYIDGRTSTCWFKSYEMDRQKWQSATLDFIWFDEEPPADIWTEGMTRLNVRRGKSLLTFTPLLGMTGVVKGFLRPEPGDPAAARRRLVRMTLEDATFYAPDQLAAIQSQYPDHERRARLEGLPVFGSGLVFPISDASIVIPPFPIPAHWRRICGMDLGIDHPTAAVWLAHDPDTDRIYMYDCYKKVDPLILIHAAAIKHRGPFVPIAWPHDGLKREPKAGLSFADLYRREGLMMLPESARYQDDKGGGQGREPILAQILQRMQTGRFKVFNTCREWLDEKATYHRVDGIPVARDDDAISASVYAMMMLRHARAAIEPPRPLTAADYDPLA